MADFCTAIDNENDDDAIDFPFEEDDDEPSECSKGKRARKVPPDIDPIVIDHYPENQTCHTCGNSMPSIGSWSSLRIRIVPEHVEFIKDTYHTCACNRGICKERKPVSAKAKNHIMKGRALDLGFVTEAACQKFFEHTPTFRMERRMLNNNINLSRQAIGRNVAHLAQYLDPVRQALLVHVKAGYAAHMDETPLRILTPVKGKCATGYLWAICRDERLWNPEAQPAVVYHYAPSRAGSVAAELLCGASIRCLVTDGYSGYKQVFRTYENGSGLISVRCWAHARRKFVEVWRTTRSKLANQIVRMIRKLYAVEKAAAGLTPAERESLRQLHSLPVANVLHTELQRAKLDAQGTLKKAISYTLNAFEDLCHFIYDGRLEIDNNPIERCIRGIALTKKNSLYAGSHDAAEVWAIYYSLIESARLNRVNPRSYLNWVAHEIECARGDIDYSQLMPWHCPTGHLVD